MSKEYSVRITNCSDPQVQTFPSLKGAISFAQEQDPDWASYKKVAIYAIPAGNKAAREYPAAHGTELASLVMRRKEQSYEYSVLPTPVAPARTANPIVGYRCWVIEADCRFTGEVVEKGRLTVPAWRIERVYVRSLYSPVLWPGPQVEFGCSEHSTPIDGGIPHQCGVHAYHSADLALGHQSTLGSGSGPHRDAVTGLVAGYGSVFVHDQGWRAEEIHVLGLLDRGRVPEIRQALAREFDVPLLDQAGLKELAARRGRAVSKASAAVLEVD